MLNENVGTFSYISVFIGIYLNCKSLWLKHTYLSYHTLCFIIFCLNYLAFPKNLKSWPKTNSVQKKSLASFYWLLPLTSDESKPLLFGRQIGSQKACYQSQCSNKPLQMAMQPEKNWTCACAYSKLFTREAHLKINRGWNISMQSHFSLWKEDKRTCWRFPLLFHPCFFSPVNANLLEHSVRTHS